MLAYINTVINYQTCKSNRNSENERRRERFHTDKNLKPKTRQRIPVTVLIEIHKTHQFV